MSRSTGDIVRYVIAVVFVVAVLGALGALKGAQISALIHFGESAKAAGPPPEAVTVAKANAQTWEATLQAVGSVTTSRGVAVSSQAGGVVTKIRFDSGDVVKQGRVLVELDSRVERAQLASARVRRDLAEANVKRTRELAKSGVATQAELDNNESLLRSADAEIKSIQAQLALKIVRAPFSGKLGIRAVNLGQFLSPGTPVTELEATRATFVDFTLPQEQVGDVAVGMEVRASVEGKKAELGNITAIEPNVDAVTRAVRLRAALPNSSAALRPGMFVSVAVVLPKKRDVVAVPATAVVHASYGDSVFVVEPKPAAEPGTRQTPDGKTVNVARQQFVRTGESRGDFVAIEKGVTAGQTLVSLGAFKLRNGAPVFESDSAALDPKLHPQLENR
jgi:membrane fusion protein (multidrug efflux system)